MSEEISKLVNDEITTDGVRAALTNYFKIMFMNPNWDLIGDIVGGLTPVTEEEREEVEQAAYTLWSQGRVVFDSE